MVDRVHIGIFGKMNAGKSSLMNLLTQQESSIVDTTEGTTADSKIALTEFHGLGPVKLFDTAGFNEDSDLGKKKQEKSIQILKECNLVILVIASNSSLSKTEQTLLDYAKQYAKPVLILINLINVEISETVKGSVDECRKFGLPDSFLLGLSEYPTYLVGANSSLCRDSLVASIIGTVRSKDASLELIPNIKRYSKYILVVPLDEESPQGRLLRPQQEVLEAILRGGGVPLIISPNLSALRRGDSDEEERFRSLVDMCGDNLSLVITDSQAIDVVAPMVDESIALTTFSVIMIQRVSGGRLDEFYQGALAISSLTDSSRVLIVEACNHSRIAEDIGIVQIPRILDRIAPGISITHNFGREFIDNRELNSYQLIIHCGGCMISSQKLSARLHDIGAVGVPYTNYGIFLSMIQGAEIAKRVVSPWLTVEP